jgi:hypothetical protein
MRAQRVRSYNVRRFPDELRKRARALAEAHSIKMGRHVTQEEIVIAAVRYGLEKIERRAEK